MRHHQVHRRAATTITGIVDARRVHAVHRHRHFDLVVVPVQVSDRQHAVMIEAVENHMPEVIVIEGQGSLMNPAYPGGFEILAAGRPDIIILQHAPAHREYDGFPGYCIQPLALQIEAIELLSRKPVVAVTIMHKYKVGVGFGDVIDRENVTWFGPGDYYVNVEGAHHFVLAQGPAVLQITGLGPWKAACAGSFMTPPRSLRHLPLARAVHGGARQVIGARHKSYR